MAHERNCLVSTKEMEEKIKWDEGVRGLKVNEITDYNSISRLSFTRIFASICQAFFF